MSHQTLSDLLDRSVEHVPDTEPPLADLLRRGRAARSRRRRTAVVGAAIASVLVVGSVAAGQRLTPGADPAVVPPTSLPAPPNGMQWVGVGRTVVAVPEAWPVVPGIYCQGPTEPYVTITQWQVAVSCTPMLNPHGGSNHPPPSVDVEGTTSGEFMARLEVPARSGDVTQRSLDASRTTLPKGWITVPSGGPAGAVGPPTVTSEIAALRAAGFHILRAHAAPDRLGRAVTTDPEIGTPALVGSTVRVYDHGSVASSATLTGRLQWVGGLAPGSPVPHAGTVHVVNADDSVDQTVGAGPDGRWEIYLPPGTYRVLATSPGYLGTTGAFDACSAGRAVTVSAGERVSVDVFCQLR